tara:strand:- start:502 stop:1098 length:597 start_codon:yes stop_codon:yes gene_type:complete
MIAFKNQCQDPPYLKFKEEYDSAVSANQKIIEAISVSSFCKSSKIVDSRYVNLKIIDDRDFIFFSNYDSPKSKQFNSHNQVCVTIFWNNINVQIRMRANIKKTSKEFNKRYFQSRSEKKNALAISSKQSNKIDSYERVEERYKKTELNEDLKKCPDYWGGFVFRPYYFEFWSGHESRLNRRKVFELQNQNWIDYFLQP